MKKVIKAIAVSLVFAGILTSCGASEYDVDLTEMTSTMVYAEVYNMMLSPNDYIGKTIKMSGTFSAFEVPETGNIYYACIVQDATACCQKGIEFVIDEESEDGYPANGDEITVTGTFETYFEGENMYCHLVQANVFN